MDFPIQEKEAPISCIYIIFCKDLSVPFEYVGRTTNLSHRMHAHKCAIENTKHTNYHLKLYEAIRSTGGFVNWEYNVLELCKNKQDLVKLERKWIKHLNPVLNIHSCENII